MCKSCDITYAIEELYKELGIIDGTGPGGISDEPDAFDAAINGPINVLSHIAASAFCTDKDRKVPCEMAHDARTSKVLEIQV